MIRACLNDWKQCVYGDKKFLDSKHGMIIETSEREEERRSERVTGEGSAWTLRVHVPSLRRYHTCIQYGTYVRSGSPIQGHWKSARHAR